jgi:23S rRNA (uracil1939-C5)-methyltransferase
LVERLAIDGLGARGDGIASSPAGAIYVPYTLPGEIVEVDPWPGHPDRRSLLRVETASAARITPICPHFGVCGGCQLQHWDGAAYLAWKRGSVAAQLRHAGIAADVGAILDAHGDGRRRAVLHARGATHDILEVGYAALYAHRIIPIDHCPILAPGLSGAIDAAWAIAETLKPAAKPLDIQVTATDSGIDVDVRGSGPLTPQLAAALAGVAEAHRLARITRHGELIAQRATPVIRIGRATVTPPPGAFLQATVRGEETLAQLALEHVGAARTVADLFAGVGPFALRIAERARVVAADSDEGAIDALRRAAAATSGLKPVAAERRDLFRRPFVAQELKDIAAVVFDPPRQGAEAQARELARSRVPVVVAVSCNAATFVRDVKILLEGGYRLGEVTAVDQFRYSPHVEVVARLTR